MRVNFYFIMKEKYQTIGINHFVLFKIVILNQICPTLFRKAWQKRVGNGSKINTLSMLDIYFDNVEGPYPPTSRIFSSRSCLCTNILRNIQKCIDWSVRFRSYGNERHIPQRCNTTSMEETKNYIMTSLMLASKVQYWLSCIMVSKGGMVTVIRYLGSSICIRHNVFIRADKFDKGQITSRGPFY